LAVTEIDRVLDVDGFLSYLAACWSGSSMNTAAHHLT